MKRLPFPNGAFMRLKLDGVMERLTSRAEQMQFLLECHRILQKQGVLLFSVPNSKPLLEKLSSRSADFWKCREWWSVPMTFADMPLDIVTIHAGGSTLFDEDTLKLRLLRAGFGDVEISNAKPRHLFPGYALRCTARKLDAMSANDVKLPLPSATDQTDSEVPVYLGLADSIHIADKVALCTSGVLRGREFYAVVGSLFCLHLIPILRPRRLILFDINEAQVRFFHVFQDIMKASPSPSEFIQRYFSRPFLDDPSAFLRQPFDQGILEDTRSVVRDQDIFRMTIERIANAPAVNFQNACTALVINDNPCCRHLTLLDYELFRPGPECNALYLKEGFLSSQQAFDQVRELILHAEVLHCSITDDILIKRLSTTPSILFPSNIWAESWLYEDADNNLRYALTTAGNTHPFFTNIWRDNLGIGKIILSKITGNPYIIDISGSIFNMEEMRMHRLNAHSWLWIAIEKKLFGRVLEIIHLPAGQWGFHEHLQTMHYKDFLDAKFTEEMDVIVFHILLANGVPQEDFVRCLEKAAVLAKRIIVLEHDADSPSFATTPAGQIADIRLVMQLIRKVPALALAKIVVEWAGAGVTDGEPNTYRNMIITCDL
ncbi:MAG: hypothetical protein J7L26_09610 [Candidatus Aminicenantes bacterium]|nr:hypothetical protein [Candidatus Aminicenantes bacterium]